MEHRVPALMWEAAAEPGRSEALLDWVRTVALPELGDAADVRLFQSHDDRVVAIIRSIDGTRPRIAADPGALVRRPPHQWLFEEVAVSESNQTEPGWDA